MREEIKKEIWKRIRNVIKQYEITNGETIYQCSSVQDNTADILYEILGPLLDELEKIDIEEIEENDFDIEKLLKNEGIDYGN